MRKTISMILLVSLWTQMVFAAGVPQKFPTDTLQIGKPSSSANKDLIFDTNLGASNPKVRANPTSGKFELNKPLDVTGAIGSTGAVTAGGAITTTSGDISTANGNISATGTGSIGGNLTIGTGAAADKSITVNRGGSNPFLKWSETALSWIFSNDGTLEKKLGTGGGGASTGVNVLTNDSFEDFVSGALLGWSNVGGTLTQQTYTNGVENDTKYFQFVATGAGQYFESALITVPTNFNGGGCQVDFKKLNIATNDLFKVEALDSSSNVLATGNVKVSSWSKFPTLSFSCPAAGATFRIRVTSLAAGTLQGDKAYLGSNQNIVSVSQAKLIGTLSYAQNTNCTWNVTGASWQNFPADTDCLAPTVTGSLVAPATKIPAFVIPNAQPGTYRIVAKGEMYGAAGTENGFRFSDGINNSQASFVYGSSSIIVSSGIVDGQITLGTAQSNWTVNLQSFNTGGTTGTVSLGNSPKEFGFEVYFFPAGQDTAVSPEQASWFIDANIGGENPALSANTSYTTIGGSNLDLVINSSKGSASAEIACTSGVASSGLNCGASAEQVGIAFTPPYAGVFEVCSWQTVQMTNQDVTLQLIETSNTSVAILQEGGGRNTTGNGGSAQLQNATCGTFNFTDTSKKTIRLMYESTGAAQINADRLGTAGQRDIKFIVRPLLSAFNRPILTGDQVTSLSNNERVLRLQVMTQCTSTPCTVTSSSGNWYSSVARTALGTYEVTWPASTFSSIPSCFAQSHQSDGNPNYIVGYSTVNGMTATKFTFGSKRSDTHAFEDARFSVICMGPK